MEALGDTLKHETQNKICQNSILISKMLSPRCTYPYFMHLKCSTSEITQPPASPHQTQRLSSFRVACPGPRRRMEKAMQSAFSSNTKRSLMLFTGKINGKPWFLKHNAKASKNKLEKSTGGSLLFPIFPPWGWIWMDAFFSETELPENRREKIEGLDAQDAGGDFWAKVA